MSRWIAILLLVASVLPSTARAATQEPFKHALIIGVSIYRDEEIPPLFGVPNDLDSAKEIAVAMGIPAGNVTELFNEQATKDRIIAELGKLAARATEGGRILVYFSGHGTRWRDPNAGGCVEGLLTWDRKVIVNLELLVPMPGVKDKSVRLSGFVDSGYTWGPGQRVRLGDMRASAGVAASWDSPVGPLKFSLSQPIRSEPGDKVERFQFQLGRIF